MAVTEPEKREGPSHTMQRVHGTCSIREKGANVEVLCGRRETETISQVMGKKTVLVGLCSKECAVRYQMLPNGVFVKWYTMGFLRVAL